jgi:hypothetical protein
VHFFIENRLWLAAFVLATFVAAAVLVGAGLSGMRMIASALGIV